MRGKNPRMVYEQEILCPEYGLEQGVEKVINLHVGPDAVISKPNLCSELNKLGFGKGVKYSTLERQVRIAVNKLRKRGKLICASSGEAGYFLASTRAEYDAFEDRELTPRITDLLEVRSAMKDAAWKKFGGQMSLV